MLRHESMDGSDLAATSGSMDWIDMKLAYAEKFYNDQISQYLRRKSIFPWRIATWVSMYSDPEVFEVGNYCYDVKTDLKY